MWMMPLHLHVNQKSDYDMMNSNSASTIVILVYFTGCPDPPTNVSLNIASSSSLLVKFGEPLNRNGAVVTKYKGNLFV